MLACPMGPTYAGLTLDNPFIPTAIRNQMIASGVTNLPFRKRFAGIVDRSNITDRTFNRVVVGVKGTAFDAWDWDAYVMQGGSKDVTASDTGLRSRYYFALDAIAGPAARRSAAMRRPAPPVARR